MYLFIFHCQHYSHCSAISSVHVLYQINVLLNVLRHSNNVTLKQEKEDMLFSCVNNSLKHVTSICMLILRTSSVLLYTLTAS